MSDRTYTVTVDGRDKPLVWLAGEIKTPPFSEAARFEAGMLLRRLQRGETVPMPASRPMSSIGKKCHELRVVDETATWRIVYRLESDAVVILDIFSKKTTKTPKAVIDVCKERLKRYLKAVKEE
jgi:phage-related protein